MTDGQIVIDIMIYETITGRLNVIDIMIYEL